LLARRKEIRKIRYFIIRLMIETNLYDKDCFF
jgi:hypothetical protein